MIFASLDFRFYGTSYFASSIRLSQSSKLRCFFASAYFLDLNPGSVMIRNPSSTQRESKAVAERGLKLNTDWISREAI